MITNPTGNHLVGCDSVPRFVKSSCVHCREMSAMNGSDLVNKRKGECRVCQIWTRMNLCKQKCCHPTTRTVAANLHSSSRLVHGPVLYATSNNFLNASKVVTGFVANFQQGRHPALPFQYWWSKVARFKWCPHIGRVSLALDIGRIFREVCRWE